MSRYRIEVPQDSWTQLSWGTSVRGINLMSKVRYMTQDERWIARYNAVIAFIESNHRNPSRHRIEEHDMLNWLKANRKRMNAGEMKEPRLSRFKELLALIEQFKRKNQYE